MSSDPMLEGKKYRTAKDASFNVEVSHVCVPKMQFLSLSQRTAAAQSPANG